MNQKPPAPVYTIRIEPSPGFDRRHETRRLARLLKAALRTYGFRCVSVLPDPPAQEERAA